MEAPDKPIPVATVGEPVKPSSPVSDQQTDSNEDGKRPPPLMAKLIAVLLISCISFGSSWSSGVTGAMKSTIKKKMHISNTQFSLLEASEDFMVTLLMLGSGIVTDRVGGAVAAATTVRSFNFMIGGRVILALGDIATQVAQYKMFSSWFPPSNGFASTLGLELAMRKIGGFVGKSTANPIAKNTGNFAWVYWTSVFMNLFTNAATVVFWLYSRYCNRHYQGRQDKATREVLTEKNNKFELKKVFQLPWMFWCILAFSLFQTSAALVFSQNATELAEKRFNVDSIKAGWYSALSQYSGFFLVPCLGAFIDILGNRATILCICGTGMLLCMVLVNFASSTAGTGAAFGIYAIASALGPTTIIDGIRTSLWHQSVFGSAYAIKVTMNNAMNIIIRIITGALQDADNDSYRRAVRVYLFLAACSVVVGLAIFIGAMLTDELGLLQWTRKKRLTYGPEVIDSMRERSLVTNKRRSWWISLCCFGALILLTHQKGPISANFVALRINEGMPCGAIGSRARLAYSPDKVYQNRARVARKSMRVMAVRKPKNPAVESYHAPNVAPAAEYARTSVSTRTRTWPSRMDPVNQPRDKVDLVRIMLQITQPGTLGFKRSIQVEPLGLKPTAAYLAQKDCRLCLTPADNDNIHPMLSHARVAQGDKAA
ncbi:hypothetical protein ETB97_009588 [Aspergillus alliaceus]|uniref:Lysosomal dipeptide transporter MFSD1 n=1 Tax=Petromyces alliaceus TaxID=209559 RepID=A0A8H6EAC2_PETAA|nr:hypothetical protein ETB97_009588 [Aspergillus burnettii]